MNKEINKVLSVVCKGKRCNLYTAKDNLKNIQYGDLYYDGKIMYMYTSIGLALLTEAQENEILLENEIDKLPEVNEEPIELIKPDNEINTVDKINIFEETLKKPYIREWNVIEPDGLIYTVNNSNHWCSINNQASMDMMYKLTEKYPEVRKAILEKLN